MFSKVTVITSLLACAICVESKADYKNIASTLKKFNIKGKEWNEAQQVINKLVDKSIANRVEEAEKEVERLLENNISDHIKKTGKAFLAGQQSSECQDTIGHCKDLYNSGVCRTSRKAMKKHCPRTCGMCATKLIDLAPHVQFVLKPKIKSLRPHSKKQPNPDKPTAPKKRDQSSKAVTKATPKSELLKAEDSVSMLHDGEVVIPEETLKSLHSIEPLLLHHSKEAVKFTDNDIEEQTEKIHDAEKLLSDVKSLEALKNINDETGAVKSKVTKAKPKAKVSKPATKSKVSKKIYKKTAKKSMKSKAVPLKALSKTVTYKNHKYKITPIVDWGKINKMLKALGFKAVNLVAANTKLEGKHLEKHLKAHLTLKDKTGSKIIHLGTKTPHAAAETFVSAVHREKSYHNKKFFKKHCHPLCLVSCISSCGEGCCKEHDKVAVYTALAKHCHPGCKGNCVPSCGSGCCSADDEKKRGHHFLHYQRIHDYKNKVKDVPHVTVYKEQPKPKPKPKSHDKVQHRTKAKDAKVNVKVKPLPNLGKHWSEGLYNSKGQLIPQRRLCAAPCHAVCAPACSDACCNYGKYSQGAQVPDPTTHTFHDDPLAPNIPFPGHRNIPAQAFACKESCKFDCSRDCPRDCCQPEAAAAIAAAQALQPPPPPPPQYLPVIQPYAPFETNQFCPNPCPSTCAPACNVACCTSALGLPEPPPTDELQDDSPANDIQARSSTRKVLHVTHVFQPLDGLKKSRIINYNACATSCRYHCSPACARSGCCDRVKRLSHQ